MKNKILAGIMLLFFALSGAAFTATKHLQTTVYLQKGATCVQRVIPTVCAPALPNPCEEEDPTDSTGPWLAFERQNPSDLNECIDPLGRP